MEGRQLKRIKLKLPGIPKLSSPVGSSAPAGPLRFKLRLPKTCSVNDLILMAVQELAMESSVAALSEEQVRQLFEQHLARCGAFAPFFEWTQVWAGVLAHEIVEPNLVTNSARVKDPCAFLQLFDYDGPRDDDDLKLLRFAAENRHDPLATAVMADAAALLVRCQTLLAAWIEVVPVLGPLKSFNVFAFRPRLQAVLASLRAQPSLVLPSDEISAAIAILEQHNMRMTVRDFRLAFLAHFPARSLEIDPALVRWEVTIESLVERGDVERFRSGEDDCICRVPIPGGVVLSCSRLLIENHARKMGFSPEFRLKRMRELLGTGDPECDWDALTPQKLATIFVFGPDCRIPWEQYGSTPVRFIADQSLRALIADEVGKYPGLHVEDEGRLFEPRVQRTVAPLLLREEFARKSSTQKLSAREKLICRVLKSNVSGPPIIIDWAVIASEMHCGTQAEGRALVEALIRDSVLVRQAFATLLVRHGEIGDRVTNENSASTGPLEERAKEAVLQCALLIDQSRAEYWALIVNHFGNELINQTVAAFGNQILQSGASRCPHHVDRRRLIESAPVLGQRFSGRLPDAMSLEDTEATIRGMLDGSVRIEMDLERLGSSPMDVIVQTAKCSVESPLVPTEMSMQFVLYRVNDAREKGASLEQLREDISAVIFLVRSEEIICVSGRNDVYFVNAANYQETYCVVRGAVASPAYSLDGDVSGAGGRIIYELLQAVGTQPVSFYALARQVPLGHAAVFLCLLGLIEAEMISADAISWKRRS